MNKGRFLGLFGSFSILAALVYFSGPAQLLSTISKADGRIIALGISFWFVASIVRTYRWKILLNKVSIEAPFSKLYKVFNAGLFISIITPGKVGDPARCALLKTETGQSFSKSLPTIVVERIQDISVMLSLGTLGFLLSPVTGIQKYLIAAGVFYSVAIGAIIWALSSQSRMETALNFFVGIFSFIPKVRSLKVEIPYFSENFHLSFKKFKNLKLLSKSILLTFTIWGLEGLILLLAFFSIGIEVSYMIVLTALMISTLVGVLTFLPGGLGSAEVVMVLFFGSLLGLGLVEVTTVALLGRFMSFWMTVFVGSAFLATIKSSKKS